MTENESKAILCENVLWTNLIDSNIPKSPSSASAETFSHAHSFQHTKKALHSLRKHKHRQQ